MSSPITPRVTSPAVVGARPGTPFLHMVRATATRPFRFDGTLPPGLTLDRVSGVIEGRIGAPGEHPLSITVANEAGEATWSAHIVVGDRLALTPPLGWMSWNAFGRDVSEAAVLGNADAMVSLGLRDAGYEYVIIDDHWHGWRDAQGRLRPDPERFPRGIPALADELHRRGLKLGIYTCAGPLTCGGEAGSEGREALDAATFAEWGVDYLKDDYCHAPPEREAAIERYLPMGAALASSGRSMVFALCEWGERAPWEWGPSVQASLWRTTGDIRDAWDGTVGIVTAADLTEPLAEWAGPGAWNDPDMLVAGLRGGSREIAAGRSGAAGGTHAEYRTQISLWAMLAAPLLASCDLRGADAETVACLAAPGILAIDQDRLGRPGRRIRTLDQVDVWERQLSGGASAAAIVNRGATPASVQLDWSRDHGAAPEVVDAWTDTALDGGVARVALAPHATAIYRVRREAGSGFDVRITQ